MTDTIYRAIRIGDDIKCGACKKGLLMKRVQGYNCILDGMEVLRDTPLFIIKCKHVITVNGRNMTCDALNEVVL